jgi:hypothetical protein
MKDGLSVNAYSHPKSAEDAIPVYRKLKLLNTMMTHNGGNAYLTDSSASAFNYYRHLETLDTIGPLLQELNAQHNGDNVHVEDKWDCPISFSWITKKAVHIAIGDQHDGFDAYCAIRELTKAKQMEDNYLDFFSLGVRSH